MSIHQFKTEQFLPIGIGEAWDFFSSPINLAIITPPELDFRILSKLQENEIFEGMKIDYILKPVLKIPIQWQTEIVRVNKGKNFTDRQLKGPYKMWEHTHTFNLVKNGIVMQDVIRYQLPLGFIGNIAHSLLVKKKIENIFIYRKNILEKMFTNEYVLD